MSRERLLLQWEMAQHESTVAAYIQWVRENGISTGFSEYGIRISGH